MARQQYNESQEERKNNRENQPGYRPEEDSVFVVAVKSGVLDLFYEDDDQIRNEFIQEEIDELQGLLEEYGQQEPIKVWEMKHGEKQHMIEDGARRHRASKQSEKIKKLDYIIIKGDSSDKLAKYEKQYNSNKSSDLTVFELAKFYQMKLEQHNHSQIDAAKSLSINVTTFNRYISLKTPSEELLKASKNLNIKDLRTIAMLSKLEIKDDKIFKQTISRLKKALEESDDSKVKVTDMREATKDALDEADGKKTKKTKNKVTGEKGKITKLKPQQCKSIKLEKNNNGKTYLCISYLNHNKEIMYRFEFDDSEMERIEIKPEVKTIEMEDEKEGLSGE